MWTQFFWENFHFSVNLFAALTFFSVFWLYFDAWQERKNLKEGLKIVGFLLLSLSFLAHAILIESSTLVMGMIDNNVSEKIYLILKIGGYIFLATGLIIDPLIAKPKLSAVLVTGTIVGSLLSPILAIIITWFYLRRSTIGLEYHIRKISWAFFMISLWELTSLSSIFSKSQNVDIFKLTTDFGPLWVTSHLCLLLGSIILISWSFSYLLKRINTQLFIIFTTTILSIFLVTAVSFSFLLLKNLSDETLARLKTDVSVLSFAVDTKKSEGLAIASMLSKNSEVVEALIDDNKKSLSKISEDLLLEKKLSGLVIVDSNGQVKARGEERERIGESMSDDSVVKRVLTGEDVNTMIARDGVLAPIILVKSATPIKKDEKIVGAVIVSMALDNNFLDGIKKITGLEASVYGEETLSATTVTKLTNSTRPIGIKETNKKVKENVLIQGKDYSDTISFLNNSYFAAYHPIKDTNNEVVGMFMIGKPATAIFETAGKSIELTFLVTVGLIIFAIFPSFLISKYIFNQLK